MNFNFNDTVTVTLTPKGLQALTDYYMDLAKGLHLNQAQAILASLEMALAYEGGLTKWTAQFHDLMEVFQESKLPLTSFLLDMNATMQPGWRDQQEPEEPRFTKPEIVEPPMDPFPDYALVLDPPAWVTELKYPFPMAMLPKYSDWVEDHGWSLADFSVYAQGIDTQYYLISSASVLEPSLFDSWVPEKYADYIAYANSTGMKVD